METKEQAVLSAAIAEYDPIAAGLAELRHRFGDVAYDLTTTKGNKEARAARSELVMLRTSVDSAYKGWNTPILAAQKAMREKAAELEAEILLIETPIDEQIRADEARREAERMENIRAEEARLAAIAAEKLEQERIAHEVRMAAERAAAEVERSEQARLAAIEAEKLAAERAELDRLREAQEAEARALRDELSRLVGIEEQKRQTAKAENKRVADELRKREDAIQAREHEEAARLAAMSAAEEKKRAKAQAEKDAAAQEERRKADEEAAKARAEEEARIALERETDDRVRSMANELLAALVWCVRAMEHTTEEGECAYVNGVNLIDIAAGVRL